MIQIVREEEKMKKKVQKYILILLVLTTILLNLVACSSENTEVKELSNEITEEQSKELLASSDSLPIGTVVLLKDSNRKVMIIGVLQFNGSDQSVLYDYSGVLYPEGLIDPKNNYLFNQDQIERIYYRGYHNEEQDVLQDTIDEAKEQYHNNQ